MVLFSDCNSYNRRFGVDFLCRSISLGNTHLLAVPFHYTSIRCRICISWIMSSFRFESYSYDWCAKMNRTFISLLPHVCCIHPNSGTLENVIHIHRFSEWTQYSCYASDFSIYGIHSKTLQPELQTPLYKLPHPLPWTTCSCQQQQPIATFLYLSTLHQHYSYSYSHLLPHIKNKRQEVTIMHSFTTLAILALAFVANVSAQFVIYQAGFHPAGGRVLRVRTFPLTFNLS